MIDAVKDYLAPKTYSIFAYICLIVRFLTGVAFTAVVIALRTGEFGKFNCRIATESTAVKTDVEKTCYNGYEQTYNSPLPFYIFVLLSIWFPIIVAVIYSLAVRRHVEEIDSADNTEVSGSTFYVIYCYFLHLVDRSLFGILFTSLQYTMFFPNGFDFEFSCSLPTAKLVTSKITSNANASQLNGTSTTCQNSTASEKRIYGVLISVLNVLFAVIILLEVIILCRRLPNCKCANGWSCDTEFVTVYFFQKPYMRVEPHMDHDMVELHLEKTEQDPRMSTVELELANLGCVNFYKEQVLIISRPCDVFYGLNTGLDDLFVNVAIHTERAPHKFPDNLDRHEIYNVYMTVPQNSILLARVVDLFYSNDDTKGNIPRTILAIGRPGIGKTVLTEKIMRDWANEVDEFYRGKIAFHFKFRWFSLNELKIMTLKTFLCFGTRLSNEKFERIYEVITNQPDKALLIFDGLDEFHDDFMMCLDQQPPPDDPNTCMSVISLFIKLISGQLLQGATVLVTSRPTANKFYSRLQFDRNVEIIGFTSDKIEEYVGKFCGNHNRSDLKPKIWNHIKSSTELLHLSYIPVNCFIVSVILFGCLCDPGNETGDLPTIVTELYQGAVDHFDKYHNRAVHGQSSEKAIKELQLLAYNGIENGQLVFNEELFDEEMKQSGLLNSLSNPIFPVQTQFCFIHLTIQEFLAAKYVTETQAPEGIKEFISSHVESGKWHLVLQFIAGLLGKKMKKLSEKKCYKDCVSAFISEEFMIRAGKLDLSYFPVFVMKCLTEVGDENVARQACETSALKDVECLYIDKTFGKLFLSDWATVVFVTKYMKELMKLQFFQPLSQECCLEVCKLLQQRCIQQLILSGRLRSYACYSTLAEPVFRALMKSKCKLNHEHCELTKLELRHFNITEECLSTLCQFFTNGHGRCLDVLTLCHCHIIPGGISILCEVLDNKLCPQLTYLDLTGIRIYDEGVRVLCNALIKHCLFKLTNLILNTCMLTDQCITSLCELLNDERYKLTVLSLSDNKSIRDKGVRMLCENVLTKKHCKLVELDLKRCSLTDKCIPELYKALLDEHCVLNKLSLYGNKFTPKGKKLLGEVETHKDCKSRGVEIQL